MASLLFVRPAWALTRGWKSPAGVGSDNRWRSTTELACVYGRRAIK